MPKRRTRSATPSNTNRTRIDLAIETLVLIGLALVPLVFRGQEWVAFYSQPKFFVLHFIALAITVLWLLELAIEAGMARESNSVSVFDRADAWLAEHRHRWTIMAVGGFGITLIISALLSPMPWISVWGRDFGDLSNELYSALSYLVIFLTVAMRTKTRDQFLRIIWLIAAVGTLSAAYGVSQYFGWDPIGRGEDLERVIGSYGNPIFFGAFLVLSAPIVIALGLQQGESGRRWALCAGSFALGLHIAALWFAGSRGPLIGGAIGLITLLMIATVSLGAVRATKIVVMVAAGSIIALFIGLLPGGEPAPGRGFAQFKNVFSELTDGVQFMFASDRSSGAGDGPFAVTIAPPIPTTTPGSSSTPIPASTPNGSSGAEDGPFAVSTAPPISSTTPVSASTPTGTDFASLEPAGRPAPETLVDAASIETFGVVDPRTYSIGNRAQIWRSGIKLLVSRDTIDNESSVQKGLRHLFGYGPDMYFYSNPLTARPQTILEGNSHAHNYLLQVWLEQGIVGLLFIAATVALVFDTGVSLLRRWVIRKNEDPLLAILVTGLLGALIGKAVEQSAGVGKVSDLLVMWALMGLVIAAVEIDFGAVRRERRVGRTLALSNLRRLIPLGAVGVAMLLALVIFVPKDVQTLRAGWIAANGFEQKASGDADAAFRSFEQARELAPDVERYFIESSELLVKTAAASSDQARVLDLLLTARAMLLDYESRDRLAWQSQLELATITAALLGHSETVSRSEVINRYLSVSVLMKPYARVQAQAAEQIVLAGEYELGAIVSQNAIRLEAVTASVQVAWWALGEAMFQLGRMDDAEVAWKTAVQRGRYTVHSGRSHRGLAFINEARGDLEKAAEHHRHADELGV